MTLSTVDERPVRPEDLFTPEQLAALEAAGYDVVGFTTWERLLGWEPT